MIKRGIVEVEKVAKGSEFIEFLLKKYIK